MGLRISVVDQSPPVSSALIADRAVMVNLQWVNDKSGSISKLCTVLIAQSVGFKKTTLNSVQLKAASEQKHVQNKDFNLKNPTNSLWVMGDVQRSNPKAIGLFTHTEDRITENLSL